MSRAYEDKVLLCLDCWCEFDFTSEQQAEYADKGYESEPKRCRACRDRRRQSATPASPRNAGAPTPRGKSTADYHSTVCSTCGAVTSVPFKPIPGRPVFCPTCHRGRAQR
jgi:CxxC-x17-CxxC domain-containing protein